MNLLKRCARLLRSRDESAPTGNKVEEETPTGTSPIAPTADAYVPRSAATIVHVDDDEVCFFAACGSGDIERVRALARVSPVVKVVLEEEDRVVVEIPWGWIKIAVPTAGGIKEL